MYEICGFTTHYKTGIMIVLCRSLNEHDRTIYGFDINELNEKVDHNKYPNIKQEYCFEKI